MKILAIIKDTFRECIAKKIILSYAIVSTLGMILISLLFSFDIVGNEVAISSIFGEREHWESLFRFEETIIQLEAGIAIAIFTLGLFVSIFSTADLIPSMMLKGRLDLYLSKSISRVQLLIGKFSGALLVVILNIVYAIIGLWFVIGLKTGIWNVNFLYSGVTIIFMYTVIFSIVLLIGLLSKSTAVIVIATYMVISASPLLANRQEIFLLPIARWIEHVLDFFYWILPKYAETAIITSDLVVGDPIYSWTPVISSVIIGIVVFNLSIYIFSKKSF
ncbi:MAG: ABC transporter permease subunit [bacterium]|nr:ABC transporter permease subunit [bacterium]